MTRIANLSHSLTIFLLFFICSNLAEFRAFLNKPGEIFNPQLWVKTHFAKGKIPPFSFTYAGKYDG